MSTYLRAPAFDSVSDLLDWSERHGVVAPTVERGPDGSWRGSVETGELKQAVADEAATELPDGT